MSKEPKISEDVDNNKKKDIKLKRHRKKNYENIDLIEKENDVNLNKASVLDNLSDLFSKESKPKKKKHKNEELELKEDEDLKKEEEVKYSMKDYEILGYSIQQSFIFFSFKDDKGKDANSELVDKDDLGWYYSTKKYCQKKKFDKTLMNSLFSRWRNEHESKYPNYKFDDSPKILPKIIKMKESLITDQERKKETVNAEIKFNSAFKELIRRSKSEFEKHQIRSNLYFKSLKFTENDYVLDIDVDAYQKKYQMDKSSYDNLKFMPKILYHPLLIYHMICHANETKNKTLWDKAQILTESLYKDQAYSLFKRFNLMNGSSNEYLSIEEYSKHSKVKELMNESAMTNLNIVKSYREESILTGKPGFVKYIHNKEKSSYVYFTFKDIEDVIGKCKFNAFIKNVRKDKPLNYEDGQKSLSNLRLKSVYKKGKVRYSCKKSILKRNLHSSRNLCFYNSLAKLNLKRSFENKSIKNQLTNKSIKEQVDYYNSVIDEVKLEIVDEIEMKLGDIEKILDSERIIIFTDNFLKSHTVAFIPNEPIVDATFNDNRENMMMITLLSIKRNSINNNSLC